MPLLTYQEKSLFFIHIPKTGGASLYLANLQHQGVSTEFINTSTCFPCTPQHYHIELLERYHPEYKNQGAFTILRNPWARLCSEYVWQKKDSNFTEFENWIDVALGCYASDPYILDNHIRPQYHFINDYVKVFLHEDYDQAEQYVNKYFNNEFDFSEKQHVNQYIKPSLTSMPTSIQNKFKDFYKQDIEIYEKHSNSR